MSITGTAIEIGAFAWPWVMPVAVAGAFARRKYGERQKRNFGQSAQNLRNKFMSLAKTRKPHKPFEYRLARDVAKRLVSGESIRPRGIGQCWT